MITPPLYFTGYHGADVACSVSYYPAGTPFTAAGWYGHRSDGTGAGPFATAEDAMQWTETTLTEGAQGEHSGKSVLPIWKAVNACCSRRFVC